MAANGMDWRRGVQEAARVLRPGGRFLFVEACEVGPGEGYLDFLTAVSGYSAEYKGGGDEDAGAAPVAGGDGEGGEDGEGADSAPLFEEVGYDQVDMVLQPHIAGVAIKAADADLTTQEKAALAAQQESDRLADMSLVAFERGIKRRKRKKKKKGFAGGEDGEEEAK